MSDQQVENFLTVCKSFDQGMLITVAPDGEIFGRPMFVAELEDDGDLWFISDIDSQKVDEIQANPHVCVTMSGGGKYVSISGQAEIVTDQRDINRLWNELWRVWYPDGPSDPRLVLIKVIAKEGEYWSNAGANRIKYLFKATKAYVQGKRPSIDESQHAKVKL